MNLNGRGTLKKQPSTKGSKEKQPDVMRLLVKKECRASRDLELTWNIVGHVPQHMGPTEVSIRVENLKEGTQMDFHGVNLVKKWKVPMLLKPGHKYKFSVTVKHKHTTIAQGHITHTAVLVLDEINTLLQRAKNFLRNRRDYPVRAKYFYRNKPSTYYTDILINKNGVMEPYLKDNNGDQGSAINGRIEGLFFAAKVDIDTGLPPRLSPFGDTRLNLPVDLLMHTESRIYFADFYCNFELHYVTLVLTNQGSEADKFCEERLIEIGLSGPNNPFLFYSPLDDRFYCCSGVGVEILYTESVDIAHERMFDQRVFFSRVIPKGRGSSLPGGIPKNAKCSTCNLYPPTMPNAF